MHLIFDHGLNYFTKRNVHLLIIVISIRNDLIYIQKKIDIN